jgi:hypothetical protein
VAETPRADTHVADGIEAISKVDLRSVAAHEAEHLLSAGLVDGL